MARLFRSSAGFTWLGGILLGLSMALLVPAAWAAALVFGDLAAAAEGNPLGISLSPVTAMLRGLLVAGLVGAEVLLPLSMAMDARGRDPGADWQPDPETYAVGGLLFPLSVPLALYYLARRSLAGLG